MRWKILLISLFLVSIVFASPTQEIISKANEFRIDLIRYDPSPVQPGKITDVWFEVTNLGEEADLEVSLAAPFPFTVLSDKPLNFKNFKTGQKVPFKFTISTNKDVQDGEYSLSLEYYSEKIEMRASEDFDVEVKRVNRFISATNVDVTSVSAKKNKIAPGEVAEVGINIK